MSADLRANSCASAFFGHSWCVCFRVDNCQRSFITSPPTCCLEVTCTILSASWMLSSRSFLVSSVRCAQCFVAFAPCPSVRKPLLRHVLLSDVQGGTDGDKTRGRTIFLPAKEAAVDFTNKLRKITFFSGNLNVRTELQDNLKWLEEKMIDSLMKTFSFLLVVYIKKKWRFFVSVFR